MLPFNEASSGRLEFAEGAELLSAVLEVSDGQRIESLTNELPVSLEVADRSELLP